MAMPRSDEELEKRITALLIAGHGTVLIDNIDKKLSGGSMAAALTTTTWRGRVLGKSEMLDIPNNATWLGDRQQRRGIRRGGPTHSAHTAGLGRRAS